MNKLFFVIDSLWLGILLALPNTFTFSRWRVNYYKKHGCIIAKGALICPNVRIIGNFSMGKQSSLAQNVSISGGKAGIKLGDYVMVAPNTVIVAFNHGFSRIDIPMLFQENIEKEILIEDDVWIGANVTILGGIRIGKGSIIAANSLVNKDVPPFSIVGGVPAKLIKNRLSDKSI